MRTRRTGRLLKNKIKQLPELKKIICGLKKRGKKIIFTNGCFDLLHYGHAKYLECAKGKGDILVVAVNSDSSVKRIKGEMRPVIDQKNRINLIASLESVDYALLFNEETPLRLIKELKPDVLVKGSDWHTKKIVGSGFILSRGGRVLTIKLVKGLSTTNLIKKVAKTH